MIFMNLNYTNYKELGVSLTKFITGAKDYTKNPLGIIALFIVLVYGIAALVVGAGGRGALDFTPLIYFLSFFPVIVFVGFYFLVARHHRKLYGPSDFKDEDNFIKSQFVSAAFLGAATAKYSDTDGGLSRTKIDEIASSLVLNVLSEKTQRAWKNEILWVDDIPANNDYEAKAFEAQGLKITWALSTGEACEFLNEKKFAVIISDMSRREGEDEGYVLLSQVKMAGYNTPYIIYSSSNLPEHKKLARERGALACTNRAQELFKLVMGAVNNGE